MSPDISMCNGDECEQKQSCYRYRATPGGWQTYFGTPPMDSPTECEYYWKLNPEYKADAGGVGGHIG